MKYAGNTGRVMTAAKNKGMSSMSLRFKSDRVRNSGTKSIELDFGG